MSLIVRDVSKAYGRQPALNDIDLSLERGQGMVALLGANGSGKSTLLRILATAITPDTGWISFGDQTYRGDLRRLRQSIGFLPQDLDLPDTLTPLRLLRYLGQLRGIHSQAVIDDLLERFALGPPKNKPLGQLSGGQVRLVGIAQALLGSPRLILLDEFLRGLDLQERERVRRALMPLLNDAIVIFSSHIPAEVEQMARYVIVLDAGRIIFCGPVAHLLETARGRVYELTVPAEQLSSYLDRFLVSRTTQHKNEVILRIAGGDPGRGSHAVSPTLEDAYLLMTTANRAGK